MIKVITNSELKLSIMESVRSLVPADVLEKISIENNGPLWSCICGAIDNANDFCIDCGLPKPEKSTKWICTCGHQNKGNFCEECGGKNPDTVDGYCETCGYKSEKSFKFCPECDAENV